MSYSVERHYCLFNYTTAATVRFNNKGRVVTEGKWHERLISRVLPYFAQGRGVVSEKLKQNTT